MNRRNFLRNASLSGLAFTTLSSVASTAPPSKSEKSNPSNKSASPDASIFKLSEITLDHLQQKMQSGELTSHMITEMYLHRINTIDKKGPTLNAVIELNPDALAIAAQLDAERKAGKIRGPLHGIPILIKDNISTGDKMQTTAGSLAMLGNISSKDAHVIKQLRDAGVVILGKTNLSEWANFRSTRSTSAWSSRGGQTKNPCVLDRNPCGSSSGSGAAVAANLCAVAVGTETNGSVIAPSSYCGIVGIKPTVGLVSRSGIIPISQTQDTAGPMARTVKDAAILLTAMAGIDDDDTYTKQSAGNIKKDYASSLDTNALKGKKIGIEKSFFKGHEGVVALYKQSIELLKKQGAEVIELDLLDSMKDLGDAEFEMMKYEFKDGLNKYLAHANAKVRSLEEVIAFNKSNEAKVMPYFKQEILEDCQTKGNLDTKEYKDLLEKSLTTRKIIDDIMKLHSLDAISGVSFGLACCIDLANGDYDTGFYFCSPAARAGYPHITVPMGKVHELPVGFSFFAGAWKEQEIINLAYAFEQASKKREAPKFIPTLIV